MLGHLAPFGVSINTLFTMLKCKKNQLVASNVTNFPYAIGRPGLEAQDLSGFEGCQRQSCEFRVAAMLRVGGNFSFEIKSFAVTG
jgi:hypothetical protein